ncbi:helix-turn-helix domain-containing protein [Curtobacterium sp. 9128]|uniref:helix-turn-helix domain-containing protein n=1 Tax=Curtobacterium sp. 9128 TaxID=1793722 RepID=UPI0037BE780A
MDREHHLPIVLDDIAAAAGISRRRLQELFREDTPATPMYFLRLIRLLHARRRLLDPEEQGSIREIAIAEQILHVPRFTQRYATMFGELPSATVARVRSQRPPVVAEPSGSYFDVQTMEHRQSEGRPPRDPGTALRASR